MKVTVCIPVYNEEKNISSVIRNILFQNQEGFEIDIIVVSSNSTDKTNEYIKEYCDSGYPVKLIIEPQRMGKAKAVKDILDMLNQNTKSDIYVFTDGDVYLGKDSIKYIVEGFKQDLNLASIVGHPVSIIQSHNIWEKIAQENCAIWHEVRLRQSNTFTTWSLSGYLFAIRSKDFEFTVWDKAIAEDAYLGLSMLLNGKKMGYEPRSLVYVKFPSNFKDYYIQKSRTRYGWHQIEKISSKHFMDLKNIQRSVIFSRLKRRKMLSFLCYIIDKLIYFFSSYVYNDKKQLHIWKTAYSTK